MTHPRNKRRLFLGAGGLILATLTMLLLARLKFTGLVVSALLQLGGASEINLHVTQASPWRVVVADLRFQVRTQAFSARRVTLTRRHWWAPSLGAVQVEQARVAVTIDGSDTNALNWATYQNSRAKVQPWLIPLDELAVNGELVVQAAALPAQVLTGKIAVRRSPGKNWEFQVQAGGPGLAMQAAGSYDVARDDLTFKLPDMTLELATWQNFVQRLVILPGGPWNLAGKTTASAEGRWKGKEFTATARVSIRGGYAANLARAVAADGIEADLEFTDLVHFQSKPGTVRIGELRTGRLVLRELEAEFAFDTAKKINVSHATLKALGGGLALEPFKYFPDLRELDAVVLVDGINVEELLALMQALPAKATGRLNGRFPLRLDVGRIRIGTGWLELKPGGAAEIQFNAPGLLTRGMAVSNPSYAVLQKVETGLLKLAVTKMRLDIRPPDAPPGRSATLHIAGQPADPAVKAPVTLDLNVSGPLEKLLNLGLDSRSSFGTKP